MSYSACQVSSNIELGCVGSVGGVSTIHVLNGSITGTSLTADGAVSGITGTGDLFEFQVQKQTSNLTETFNISFDNSPTSEDKSKKLCSIDISSLFSSTNFLTFSWTSFTFFT